MLIKFGEVLDVANEQLPFVAKTKKINKISELKLENGDIVFADAAEDKTVGKCTELFNIIDKIVISGLHTIPCRPQIAFATAYLGYFFNSPCYRTQLLPLMQGIKVLSLSKTALLQTDIFYPKDQSEQARIGTFFRHLDRLITLHQCNCNMATRPCEWSSGLRAIAWEQRKLGEISRVIARTDPNSRAPVMMITAENGFILQSDRYAFDNSGASLQKYILLKERELAYNHGASKLRPYGSCFALEKKEARIPFVYHCFSVFEHDPFFISLYLNGAIVEKQLRKLVSSGARMDGLLNISFEQYASLGLLTPPKKEQEAIVTFFRHLDRLITLHQRKHILLT